MIFNKKLGASSAALIAAWSVGLCLITHRAGRDADRAVIERADERVDFSA
jgi:hypothetical protein